MAWIEQHDDRSWTDELATIRPGVVDPEHDRVDNIIGVHSLDPSSMSAHLGLYRHAMAGTKTLRKVEREMIALVVSAINDCEY